MPGYNSPCMPSGRLVRTGALGALLLVAMSLLALGCGSSSSQSSKMAVALQDDAVFLQRQYYNRDLALQQAARMGVTRLRVLVIWNRVPGTKANSKSAPATIHYDWSQYDSLIDDAARHGIRLQLDLTGPAPAWATGDHKAWRLPAERLALRRVRRGRSTPLQGPRGSVQRSGTSRTTSAGWRPSAASRSSTGPCTRRPTAAIKRADPSAQVLIGETAPVPGAGTRPRPARVPARGGLPHPDLRAHPAVHAARRRRLRAPPLRLRQPARRAVPGRRQRDDGHPGAPDHRARPPRGGQGAAHARTASRSTSTSPSSATSRPARSRSRRSSGRTTSRRPSTSPSATRG